MANLDLNFLARPDFVVSTGENGQTITLLPTPKKTSVGTFEEEVWNITGWTDINFLSGDISLLVGSDTIAYGLHDINPSVSDNVFDALPMQGVTGETANKIMRIINFVRFIELNPVHVKSLNIRTGNENLLPQQIIIQHPNIFSGYSTQQIIDVASTKTAYQYQNGVITIPDVDIILSRNCNIRFNCSCSVYDGDNQYGVETPENQLYIDFVIDKYLSLEKALMENLKLM